MVNISSVVMYGFPFFVSDLGKGGHAEQQTLTFIDVCISVAKHTTQPRHHPHLFRSTGNNVVYFF